MLVKTGRTPAVGGAEDHRISTAAGLVLRYLALLVALAVANSAYADFSFSEVDTGMTYSGETWGASWGDYDNDGLPDLYTSNHVALSSVYHNNGDGTFTDEIVDLGLYPVFSSLVYSGDYHDTHGSSWGDFNNDGYKDLMLVRTWNDSVLLRNDGGTHFTDVTEAWGTPGYYIFGTRDALWLDFNFDGKLDVFLPSSAVNTSLYRQDDGTFTNTGDTLQVCDDGQYAQISDINVDGVPDFICEEKSLFPGRIYDTTTIPFTDMTSLVPQIGASQDSVIADFDNDLRPDIFDLRGVKRPTDAVLVGDDRIEAEIHGGDSMEKSLVFRTAGSITISIYWPALRHHPEQIDQVWIGSGGFHPTSDVFTLDPADPEVVGIKPHDPASRTDRLFYIGYTPATQEWQVVLSPGGTWWDTSHIVTSTAPITDLHMTGVQGIENPLRPVLYMNRPDGFVDTAQAAGFGLVKCISAVAEDFDNDMDQDLYLACRDGASNTANRLYENLWNEGSETFRLVPGAGGAAGVTGPEFASGAGTSESVVTADFDADGYIDLFNTNGGNLTKDRRGGPNQLFRNNGNGNHWIELRLQGTTSNRDAVGTTVIATTSGGEQQMREQNGGSHRWSQNESEIVHFGLAQYTAVDLEVIWPDGTGTTVQNFSNCAADHIYTLVQGGPSPCDQPTLSIDDVTVDEGAGTATFTVSLSEANPAGVTVDYETVQGTATAGSDYTGIGTTQLVFGPSDTSQTIDVTIIDDEDPEGDETFTVQLSNASGATIVDGSGVGTILANDGGGPAPECGTPSFDKATESGVFLYNDCGTDDWHIRVTAGGQTLSYLGTLTSSPDFISMAAFLFEGNDQLPPNFVMNVGGAGQDGLDFTIDPTANVCLDVTGPAGMTITAGSNRIDKGSTVSLPDFGPCSDLPALSIDDVAVDEGAGTATFTVSLSEANPVGVTVDYETLQGTATAGSDYTGIGTTQLVFGPSDTSQTIDVTIIDDEDPEGDETFTVQLSNASGATILDGSGVGTILANDGGSGPTPECGTPSFDKATESGVFLYNDCGTDDWHIRVTAGGQTLSYLGTLTSSPDFISMAAFLFEGNDQLPPNFVMNVGGAGQDGLDFTIDPTANVCLDLTGPMGMTITAGSNRIDKGSTVSLPNFGPCPQ